MSGSRYSRKWKAYVIQNVHGMLGWARSFDAAQSYFDDEVRNNLNLMDRSDGYGEHDQHRFTLDSVWNVREFLTRWPDEAARVRQRMLERRLEVGAYEASVPDLCFSGEEFIRCLSTRAQLERLGYGRTALVVHTDIHSYSIGFPSLAAGSGIKYLLVGTNTNERCGFPRYPAGDVVPRGRALFWWEGIDGQRLLCFHYGNYFEASDTWDGGEFDPALLEGYLGRFEAMGDAYPYDAVVMLGTGGDGIRGAGFHQTITGTDRIRRWNTERGGGDPANFDAPLLVNGPAERFFEYVEARYGPQIPVLRGGWGGGDWLWDTQAQRFAKAGLQARQASAQVQVAETLSAAQSLLLGTDYPRDTIHEFYRYRIWHDEHDTNGTRPHVTDAVKQEWRAIQQEWGRDRLETPASRLLEGALNRLASSLSGRSGRQLMVYNPLARVRSDVARWPCPPPAEGRAWRVTDPGTGNVVPSQYVQEGDRGYLLFIAREVPCLGYCTYVVEETAAAAAGGNGSGARHEIENAFYRVACDASGAIVSVYDRQAGREIVRPGAAFNRYVNCGSSVASAAVSIENDGPVARNLCIRAIDLPDNTQALVTRVWLYEDLERIDIVNAFAIDDAVQEVTFDFPLALGGSPTFTLEGPAATILVAGQDEFDEAKLAHWNTFGFLDASSPDYGVTLCSPDARQAYLGGRIQGDQMPHSNLSNPEIVVRVIGGGPLDQDWIDPNGGPGDNPYCYRFSLSSHPGPVDVTHAVDQGWAALLPLQVHETTGNLGDNQLPDRASIWRVPRPLLVSAFKAAEDGSQRAYILRLWNPTDAPVTGARVTSDLFLVDRARVNDHAERDTGPELSTGDEGFALDVGAHAMVSVRVWLGSALGAS